MNYYKFAVGQEVRIKFEDRWVGEYEVVGKIASFSYFLNGKPTYNIQTVDGTYNKSRE